MRCGKLFLVDLAGSERLKKSGSTGIRANEARAINLSLSTLGMCVAARADKSLHVPFRSSKLTRLLQVGGGGLLQWDAVGYSGIQWDWLLGGTREQRRARL